MAGNSTEISKHALDNEKLISITKRLLFSYAAVGALFVTQVGAQDLASRMPRSTDYTSMWWVDGFPTRVPGARWLRCIQTGSYAMVLNTETMKIPHFGPVTKSDSYSELTLRTDRQWEKLPSADLKLEMTVDGKVYRCKAGGEVGRFTGPRLIESGRFFQRADVTDLVFVADDGERLNCDARFETAAWADRLSLILAAQPGPQPIRAGEPCFGRVAGGFGLDGNNHWTIPHDPALDSKSFTMALWVYVPSDYQAAQHASWLICKNAHEQADGNVGITIQNDVPIARMNIGGGRQNAHATKRISNRSAKLSIDSWNHLAMSYDGKKLRIYLNGKLAGDKQVGRVRKPAKGDWTFGLRPGNQGQRYGFRGVIDEVEYFDRELIERELRQLVQNPNVSRSKFKPSKQWSFDANGKASDSPPREPWKNASMAIQLRNDKLSRQANWKQPVDQPWTQANWQQLALTLDQDDLQGDAKGDLTKNEDLPLASPLNIQASVTQDAKNCVVEYDSAVGWHRVNLDKIEPIVASGDRKPSNDAIERVKLVLSNPTDREEVARLMFEKTPVGILQRIGSPITGISAILRDADGHPTGIPVQLSKNWHSDPQAGVYNGLWFHGISQVRLPPNSTTELELAIAYGHWGGVATASHAQLCLIGWGNSQLWGQSALGSWGESICYDPDQVQANCTITDVRPLMVRGKSDSGSWDWTTNVGGGDLFRFFDPEGQRLAHQAMRTAYHRYGPCLTEVTHAGEIGTVISHSATVSLARTDDVVRGIYRIRMDVREPVDFSRFVVFQIGADTYNSTRERKFAIGDESGVAKVWKANWGGDVYHGDPIKLEGQNPWASLHSAEGDLQETGATANRGFVIRNWDAKIGGKQAVPWIAERGLESRSNPSSILDLVPPPGVDRLERGDFIEATIEHLVVPQFANDYYGPSKSLKTALGKDADTWRMIHREAVGDDRDIEVVAGTLKQTFPDVRINTLDDRASFKMKGGLGYLPVTFVGLTSNHGYTLTVDGKPLDQSIHGNDFWQTEFDPLTRRWSVTYNVPADSDQVRTFSLSASAQ